MLKTEKTKSNRCNKCNEKFLFKDIYYSISVNKYVFGIEFIRTNFLWYQKVENRYCKKCFDNLELKEKEVIGI